MGEEMSEDGIPYELGIMANAHNYRRELLRIFEPWLGSRILEVGAGIGFFSELLSTRPATEHLCVVEPDPVCRAAMRTREIKAELHEGTVFSLPAGVQFSSVVSSNVLEHIKDDSSEIGQYFKLLEPGGYFCLFVPARQELYAPIDRKFGHYRRYDRSGLRNILEQAGFQVKQLHYFNLIGYFLWWLSFVALRRTTFNPAMVSLYDHWVFPVSSFLERQLMAPPVGQSLLAIAQKPEK